MIVEFMIKKAARVQYLADQPIIMMKQVKRQFEITYEGIS